MTGPKPFTTTFTAIAAALLFCPSATALADRIEIAPAGAIDNWHQAAGPHGDWRVNGEPPLSWSVTRNENIRWRTPLPEAGMSSITVWDDRLFTTTHVPIESLDEQDRVKDIIGYCLDAESGRILWTVDLPGSAEISIADGFTDGTVFAPITDGKHVWFFNRCGSIGCFDMSGRQVWLREYTPRYKHSNRQFEPVLVGDTLLNVEVHDKINGAKMSKWTPDRKKQAVVIPPEVTNEKDVWTYIHGIDKRTGKVLWREDVGTSIHNTPTVGTLADGTAAIVHARGGPHGPLEKPFGVSLTLVGSKQPGTTLWSTELAGLDPSYSNQWNAEEVYGFLDGKHVVLDTQSGELLREQPLYESADLWKYNTVQSKWEHESHAAVKAGKGHPNTNQANIVVGEWHYFLSHNVFYIGRVHVKTGHVEYLEAPAQLIAADDARSNDTFLWGQGHKNRPTNARGLAIGRKGNTGTGWGHISAASPTLVGRYLFLPVVTGTVYVIDTTVEQLSPDSLVTINDLGPGGETWTLASLSFVDGRLYAHTMREIICIGE